jgi:ankyrin repeat protein
MTPLEFAVITGDEATVKSLLAHGADVNVYDKLGMNAIAHAIRKDNWTIVQLLLNHNAHLKDVRLLGKGVTPLMVAANEGSQPMVEHLLALGVDPHVHDTEGMTAADFARGNGHRQLAAFLEKRMAAAPTTRK